MRDIEQYEQAAYELGKQHALNAASFVIDGNVKREAIAFVLEQLDAGDPAVDDHLPRRPDLSGEWADDLTPEKLADAVDMPINSIEPGDVDKVCDAYERGVSDHFEQECERILREAL